MNFGCIRPPTKPVDFRDKQESINYYISQMLCRTQSVFEYGGLPDTIPKRNLEMLIQINGFCGIAKAHDDNLYAFDGGLGGNPNPYYMPTVFTVTNPALNFNKQLKIDEECIIIPNDSYFIGLQPMFVRYATLLSENMLSIRIATVTSRLINLISTGDDATKSSAEIYLSEIEKGNLGVLLDDDFVTGIRSQPLSSTGNITQLIELQQYLKAGWYNDIGLSANYNMKREAINSSEAQLGQDALLPLIDDMLVTRQTAIEKVNTLFGTTISVKLNSAWDRVTEEKRGDEQ